MKTLNKMMAVLVAATCVGNAVALPNVSAINTRVSNILDKIGVDGAGFDAGVFTINGSNDLGTFSTGSLNITPGSDAQDIADVINDFTVVNTTVYVPQTVDSVNGVRADGLEDMLLNALAFKIDEITGDIGSLTSSYADGKLAFETALNNGDAIIAPSSVDYSNVDAQTWFGVKNSLDIFTAATNGWVAGIQELNGDMNGDGVRDSGRFSHFDADVVVGAEVADYAADQDVTTDVGLQVSTFAADGTETVINLDLGNSYDRDKLAAASVASGSTTISERDGILSGETIFSAARHEGDTTGYAADILSALDSTTLTTTTDTVIASRVYLENINSPQYSGWFNLLAGVWTSDDGSTQTSIINSVGGLANPANSSYYNVTGYVAGTTTSVTTIDAGALDSIKNSEIKGYATELLTNTVDTSSPQWLQDLSAGI